MKGIALFLIFGIISLGLYCFLSRMSPCDRCETSRRAENASMVFLNSRTVCDSLFDLNFDVRDSISGKRLGSCNRSNDQIHLEGFYVSPRLTNLTIDGNSFYFYPVWVKTVGGVTTEVVTSPIELGVVGTGSTYNNTIYILMTLHPNGFNHNILQFNNLAIRDTFMKAYISKHELMQITNNCRVIGICGGTVETGNIGNFSNVNNLIVKIRNKEYFTYRFVGFNEYRGGIERDKTPPVERNQQLLLNSNLVVRENTVEYHQDLPGETWATPCPPMWRSQ